MKRFLCFFCFLFFVSFSAFGQSVSISSITPASVEVCEGEMIMMTATSDETGTTGTVSYRWQIFTGPPPSNWMDISDDATYSGTTTLTLTITTDASLDGEEYRIVMSDDGVDVMESGGSGAILVGNIISITNPGNQEDCSGYILPTIVGTNLTGGEGYYDDSQANGGSLIAEGTDLSTSQTVYIYDSSGVCEDEINFDVVIGDTDNPTAICQDITVQLDATGNTSIAAGDVNNGSNDACGIASLTINNTAFNCENIGTNTVTLTVTDNNSNESTCNATVTVEDNIVPIAICQDITVQLDATGNTSIVTGDVNNGSNDACGIASLTINNTAFNCENIGTNTVTLTVTDNNSNESTCNATVTVEDNIVPIAICQDITVQLDATGNTSIVAGDVNNGSNDACGIASLTINNTAFNCENIGTNTVTLTVTDNNSNESTCNAIVTVEDSVNPTPICQDIIVQLDATGNTSIVAGDVNNGSNDACGIASLTINNTAFNCGNIGTNTVTLTVTDNNSNESTCNAIVTVEDSVNPTPICQDIIVQLDATGNTSIVADDVNNGSNDICGIASLTINNTAFNCENIGTNTVTLTVTDNNSNESTCDAIVTVEDSVNPTPICQDIIVQLDATGNTSIVAGDVNNGSNDACGIASLTINNTAFNCGNIGTNTVTLTVTDNNSNESTCDAIVTVEDSVVPTAMCQASFNVFLDSDGNGTLNATDINNNSLDACDSSLSLEVNISSFDCNDVGNPQEVELTVTDNFDNFNTCTTTVNIIDNNFPEPACKETITLELTTNGTGSILPEDIDSDLTPSSDNCSFTLIVNPNTFNCNHIGDNTVTLTATDNSDNSASCTSIVTVIPNSALNASLFGMATICEGFNNLLEFSATGGVAPYDIFYSIGGTPTQITTNNSGEVNLDVSPTETTNYIISSVTDANGCEINVENENISITVNNNPEVSFTTNSPIEVGDPLEITNSTITGTGDITSWEWTFAGGSPNSSDSQNPEGINYSTSDTYEICLDVSDTNNCVDENCLNVEVLTPDECNAIINFNQSEVCISENINFSDNSVASTGNSLTEWMWNFGANASMITSTNPNPGNISFNSSGMQTVILTITDSGGCTHTTSLEIEVFPTPSTFFPNPEPLFCEDAVFPIIPPGMPQPGSYSGDDVAGSFFNVGAAGLGEHEVTYTYISDDGCPGTATGNIIVAPLPEISFNSPPTGDVNVAVSINASQLSNGAASITSWDWNFGFGATPTGQDNSYSVVYSSVGVRTITLTVMNDDGCSNEFTTTINIGSGDSCSASFSPNMTSVCLGQPIIFTDESVGGNGAIVSWNWNFGSGSQGGNTSSGGPHTISYTTPGIKTVSLDIENTASCTNTTMLQIEVYDLPDVDIDALGEIAINTNLSVSGESNSNIVSWEWNFGEDSNPLTGTGQNPEAVVYNESGPKVITLTVVDSNGCENTTTHNITVTAGECTASFTSSVLSVCLGETIVLTDASLVNNGFIQSWNWNFGLGSQGGNTSSGGPHTISYTTPGIKTVSLEIATNVECTNTTMLQIEVYDLPDVDIDALGEIAINTNLSVSGESNSNIVSWEWNFGEDSNPLTGTGQNPEAVVYNESGPKVITLTVVDSNGCENTTTHNITVTAGECTASFTSSALSVCLGETIVLTDASLVNNGFIQSWNWNFGSGSQGGNTSSEGPHTISYTTPGTKMVSLEIATSVECTNTTMLEIEVYDLPDVDINALGEIAINTNLSVSGESNSNIVSWEWNFGEDSNPLTGTGQNPEAVVYNESGPKVITLTVVDSNGCENTTTHNITVTAGECTASFTSSALSVCLGETIVLTDASLVNNGFIQNWEWNFGLGSQGGNTSSEGPHTISYTTPGIKTVSLEIATNVECTNTTMLQIEVYDLPDVDIDALGEIAINTNLSVSGESNSNIVSWEWNFGEDSNPLTGTGQNPEAVVYNESGPKVITLTVVDSNGCENTTTHNITVTAGECTASFTSSALSVCLGETIVLTDASLVNNGFIQSWNWNFGSGSQGGNTSSEGPHTISYTTPGIKTVSLEIATNVECTNITTLEIEVYDLPSIDNVTFSGDINNDIQPFEINENIEIIGFVSHPNSDILINPLNWNFGDGFSIITQNELRDTTSGEYLNNGLKEITLSITDANGCSVNKDTTLLIGNANCNSMIMPSTEADTLCRGTSILLDGSGSSIPSGQGEATYNWKINDGTEFIGQETLEYVLDQVGVNTITLNVGVTGQEGCTQIPTIYEVYVNELGLFSSGTFSTSGTEDPFCYGQQLNFSGNIDIPEYIDQYSWLLNGEPINDSNGNPLITNNPILFAEVETQEDFNITLIAENDNGCSVEITEEFSVDENSTTNPPVFDIIKIVREGASSEFSGTVLLYPKEGLCYDWYSQSRLSFEAGIEHNGVPIVASTDDTQPVFLSEENLLKSQYISFNDMAFDTSQVYWVEVWEGGENCNADGCKYRIYLNNELPSALIPGFQIPLPTTQLSLSLYPNPNTGNFTLKLEGQEQGVFDYQIVDNIGREVDNGKIEREGYRPLNYEIDNQNLADGLYFMMVTAPSGHREVVKFVVQR